MYVESISTYPVAARQTLIEWRLAEATAPGNYLFWVERANSPEGPWELLTLLPLVNEFFFVDVKSLVLSKEPHVYYRVKVQAPDGEEVTSGPKDLLRNLERRQFLQAREVIRKEILRFQKFAGIRVWVLKKKHFGTPCQACVDPVSGYKLTSDCELCFGTRWEGGFEPPIEAWAERGPMDDNKGLGGSGWMTEDFETQIRMISYPLITRDDIIVEAETNVRFRVLRISFAELRAVPVVQIITARFIPRNEIEYKVVVDSAKRAKYDPYGKTHPVVQPEALS